MKREVNKIHLAIACFIFSFLLFAYTAKGIIISTDSSFFVHTAMSLIHEGNATLDEYENLPKKHYSIEKINQHYYDIYPIGTSLLAVPFVFLIEKISDIRRFDLDNFLKNNVPNKIENFIASFLVSLAAVLFYLLTLKITRQNLPKSLLATFIFAFCTSVWSTASRTLWQHGPTILLLVIILHIIISAKQNEKIIQLIAFPLAFSYLVRPTNSIIIFILTLFVLFNHRRYFIYYFFWLLLSLFPFFIYNSSIYHSFLSPYYSPSQLFINFDFFKTLLGHLISPSRGLFIFSPILIFVFGGIYKKFKKENRENIDYYLLAIIIFFFITISSFKVWWGGHSIGPRFLTDMMPLFIYFIIPILPDFKLKEIKNKKIFHLSFITLLLFSFFVQYRSVTNYKVWEWNTDPIGIDLRPERTWDWCDIQFLNGINYCGYN